MANLPFTLRLPYKMHLELGTLESLLAREGMGACRDLGCKSLRKIRPTFGKKKHNKSNGL
jgi:hypothetical protein